MGSPTSAPSTQFTNDQTSTPSVPGAVATSIPSDSLTPSVKPSDGKYNVIVEIVINRIIIKSNPYTMPCFGTITIHYGILCQNDYNISIY